MVVTRAAFWIALSALGIGCQSTSAERAQDGPVSQNDPTKPVASPGTSTPSPDAADASVPQTPDGGASATGDASPPPPPPKTIVTTETVDVGGIARSYVLATPRTYAASKSYPLVLVLHGDNGDGPTMRALEPFDEISGDEAVVAYPTGVYGWDLYKPADSNTELAFLVALVAALQAKLTIDPARVFATGFSSGAFMVNQTACRRPSLFRAIAPHSGGAPSEPNDPSASKWAEDYTRCPSQTLGGGPAVMVIHGTTDSIVPYAGGEYSANYWAYVNGCATTRTATAPSPCEKNDACPADKPVVFCAIAGMDHVVWASAATATWQFFKGF